MRLFLILLAVEVPAVAALIILGLLDSGRRWRTRESVWPPEHMVRDHRRHEEYR